TGHPTDSSSSIMQPSRQLTARLPGYAALLRRVGQQASAPSVSAAAAVSSQQQQNQRLGPLAEQPALPRCPLPGTVAPAAAAGLDPVSAASAARQTQTASAGDGTLELTARPCPNQLRRDLVSLLGAEAPVSSSMNVITLAHRTRNDMSGWSTQVQEEREELTEQFVAAAAHLCRRLRAAGYWCDFIDPTSGRPMESSGGTDTLFETDERYRSLGFDIEDLGCCKVIMHAAWGARVFVGALFTNAPVDHPLLVGLAASA
ncbi:hypothetical protein BOX15_Mlig014105g1, partial [Macrostomum lignano]